MSKDDPLSLLGSEFKLWGVHLESQKRGNNHIELRWRVSPEKKVRSYTIANTPSDHRGWLNARADIRRLFRADGLDLKKPDAKKTTVLEKALSLPKYVEPVDDQIRMLRAEIGDLTEIVFELTGRIEQLLVTTSGPLAPAMPSPVLPAPVLTIVPLQPKSVRGVKALDFLSESWMSTEAVARAMGLSPTLAYRKLYYLSQKDRVEMGDGRWRLKPGLRLVGGMSGGARAMAAPA